MSSSIWEHFEKISDNAMAKCLLCDREYSYKTTTSNLKKHLMHKHLNVYHKVLGNPESNYSEITVNSENALDNDLTDVELETERPNTSHPEPVDSSELKAVPTGSRTARPQNRAESKEKWKNLRRVYVHRYKQSKHGLGKSQKKPYYIAEDTQYTIPYTKASALKNLEKKRLSSHLERQVERETLKRKCDHSSEENSNKMFLLSVLSDMNKMNSTQKRVFKRKLLSLVDNILDNENDYANMNRSNNSSPTPNSSSAVYITENNINEVFSSDEIDQNYSADEDSDVFKTEDV